MNIIINTNDDQDEDEILKKKIEMNLKTRESLESENTLDKYSWKFVLKTK